jgi:hypothetical protein
MTLPFPPPALSPEARLLRRRPRRWSLLLGLGLLASGALGCSPAPAPQAPASPPSAQADLLRQQQQQLALRQCQQRRQELLQGLAELRRAEARLADERAAPLSPLPAPPIWDEAREQRFSQVDQQLDRQRYEQELAAWKQLRAERRAEIDQQRLRLTQAQQRLDRQAQGLQKRYPGLFTGPNSIEVKPQELERLSRCPATPA